jgi:16S rRNA processing protein RimM
VFGVTRAADDEDLVLVGQVAKPHGLRGEVVINPETDFPEERFAPGAQLLMRRAEPAGLRGPAAGAGGSSGRSGRAAVGAAHDAAIAAIETVSVASVRFHNGRPIVRFAGRDSIDQVETLGGATLWIRADSRPPLPEGHYYHDALIGCDVETLAGERVGQVTRIDAFGSAPLLAVTDGRHEMLIPLAEAICVRIDPAARRIVIDPPDGLLDVNL